MKKTPNITINTQVRTIDILPTILDIINVPVNKKKKLPDGSSMLKLIKGAKENDRLAFSETGGVDGLYPSPDKPNVRCVSDGEWKLIQNLTTNQFELYNTNDDPDEINNLINSEKHKKQRQMMVELYWKELKKNGDHSLSSKRNLNKITNELNNIISNSI